MVKLDDYIYRNLQEYGNCVIGYRFIKQYGKEKILEHLQTKGFNSQLIITHGEYGQTKTFKDQTYILELEGYGKKNK